MTAVVPESVPVVILAGGEQVNFTGQEVPKALVRVNGVPALFHVLRQYAQGGFRHFVLCLGDGYRKVTDEIAALRDLPGVVDPRIARIELLFTGGRDQTGSRLLQAYEHLGGAPTLAVGYVDVVSDVDVATVFAFHEKMGRLATLTAVHLPTRFKVLGTNLLSPLVRGFAKKPIVDNNLISGGYYFLQAEALESYKGDARLSLSFENGILPALVAQHEVVFYRHEGYWQSIDSRRDVLTVERFLTEREERTN